MVHYINPQKSMLGHVWGMKFTVQYDDFDVDSSSGFEEGFLLSALQQWAYAARGIARGHPRSFASTSYFITPNRWLQGFYQQNVHLLNLSPIVEAHKLQKGGISKH